MALFDPKSADSFLYGSQYYRAPSPRKEDWDRDLAQMAKLGFNAVKFWAQWRWNNPAEDEYDFSDLDLLMDLSQEHGLRVMLNTIVDVAPAWIYHKYPDASMLTLGGQRVGPQTQPHRQIGGLGVCLNHAEVMRHLGDFVRATVERYTHHAALDIWNVASEPELTQSMSELRLYANDSTMIKDMLCFCPRCEQAFGVWLREKYGTINKLNVAWNRNYRSFDEAELPRTRNTFNDVIDWRMFFVDTLGQNVRRRFEIAREVDEGRHPLMCHHVFIQGFPVVSTANDPWNVGRYGDLHGFTQMDDAMMHDVLRCCAGGKPVISAEMLMLYGYTLDLPQPITANDIKRHVFTGIAANLKGFLFWQYRPETLGREAPAWGLSRLDGSSTPWLEEYAKVGAVLQKHRSFLNEASPRSAEVAIYFSPENQIFAWAATGSENTATDSLLGAHRALYEHNFVVDFLHPTDFERDEALARYRAIIVPFPYLLTARICSVLKRWVSDGGVLIGECYFAGWNIEEGRHHTTVPGCGLHEVFGARQTNAEPLPDDPVTNDRGRSRRDRLIEIITAKDLPFLEAGGSAYGALVKEVLRAEGAEVLAHFSDGGPAVTLNNYGKGKAILIGSYVGLPYKRFGCDGNANLLASLVEMTTQVDRPRVEGPDKLRVDVLKADGTGPMVIVQNPGSAPVDAVVQLPDPVHGTLAEQFDASSIEVNGSSEGSRFRVLLEPNEVKVYFA